LFILLFMFCIRRVSPAPSAPLTAPEEVLLHRAENFFIFFAPLALPYKTGFLFPEKCAIIGAVKSTLKGDRSYGKGIAGRIIGK